MKTQKAEKDLETTPSEETAEPEEKIEDYLKVDTLEIEIGYGLIPLVNSSGGNDLLDRITIIRRQMAGEMGIIVPPVRIRDNVSLKPNEYQVKIRGLAISSSDLYPGQLLAINPGTIKNPIAGMEAIEPAFGLPAVWIEENQRSIAEKRGYTVVEPTAVLATHLTEIIRSHAAELITRQEVSKLIDNVKTDHEALVDELIPNLLNVGQVQHVLQNLLAENVPIRDLPTILEALADYAPNIKEPDILSEYARQALARTITTMCRDDDGGMKLATLDTNLEKLIADSIQSSKQGILAVLPPEIAQNIINEVSEITQEMAIAGYSQVILTSPNIRLAFRRLISAALPKVIVISFNELMPDVEIESIKTVRLTNGD